MTAERLWSKALADGTGCWIWQRSVSTAGYGHIWDGGKLLAAHRVAYELVKGLIPEGLTLDHLCRNRRCINPDHLEAVTHRVNVLRGESFAAENANKARCPQGHPYNEANTYLYPSGARACHICRHTWQLLRAKAGK